MENIRRLVVSAGGHPFLRAIYCCARACVAAVLGSPSRSSCSPAKLTFESIIGEREIMTSPGYVEFGHPGQTCKLLAAEQGTSLFFVIRDKTSGKTTYAASRFLHADAPKDGVVVLDFNKLENPPCAFTPYATCPLPPQQNRLPIEIEAGEMKYGDH